jgi:hypothetical protein
MRQLGERQCSEKERQMLGGKQGRKQESGQAVNRKAEGRRRQGRRNRRRGKGRGQRRKDRRWRTHGGGKVGGEGKRELTGCSWSGGRTK